MEQAHPALAVQCLLKDYKEGLALMVVVKEKGTWKRVLPLFLQNLLEHVCLSDSVSVENTKAALEIRSSFQGKKCFVESMYIKVFYYSL